MQVLTGATPVEEFRAFVETAKDPLHRMAYLLCGDSHRADELTQATFERTWRAWSSARDGDPLAYARRILANLRIDTWRRNRREVLTGEDGPERSVGSDPAVAVADRDAVVRALLQLPVKQRRVVVLRHLLDLSEAEVATELGIPLGTVKSTASRALDRLRTILTDHPEGAPE
ncbi:SigE family RNA polymerase sigma factor [Isoptericola sp. b490]|uniref:SigE family RNA polymerase sigma factor n=1 Tax=Actinotalea lenta TaxID=3064654 RepID=UPI002713D549|nr:SigE family RNA polymerase sigma factor [Isoptericola sp. b490]MDO8121040.1 SigE family RNA polymerase sigma factor [Isoptericola sp. b490]